jgi:two-component system sensor histidine kinase ChiS
VSCDPKIIYSRSEYIKGNTRSWFIPFFFLLLFLFCGCTSEKERFTAMEGFLDLSGFDFEKNDVIYLDGQWEFFWHQLLSPNDLNNKSSITKTGYFSIPGYWNGYIAGGRPLSGDGCATFRLKVMLGPGHKALALRIEDQSTAYRLWANGVEVMGNGVVGANAASMKPYYRISTASLSSGVEHVEFVLQVSNFHMSKGGAYRRIALGTLDTIDKRRNSLFAMDLLLFGMLGVIGIYHLVFYLLRRKDPSLMYFGFFCLFWCVGIPFGAVGGRFITLIFPNVPWYWLCRMELLSWFPIVPLFLMFFASLFPLEFSSKITRFSQFVGAAFFTYVLFAPSRIVSVTEVPYQVFSIVIALYICLSLYRAVRRRRSEAVLMLAGFLFFVVTMINDILFMNLIIYSIYVVSVGIAVMILFQSFALSRRFAQSFYAVESLTTQLEEKNIALSRLDKLKDEFLANTSHELRTPLNGIIGIAESLIGGITGKLPEKTQNNLTMIVSSGKRLASLINDILDASRLKNGDIHLYRRNVDIKALVETVLTIIKPLAVGKPIGLYNNIPGFLPPVWGDEDRLQQIFFNLIGNAVKFTDQGDIKVSAMQKDSLIEIFVADTGIGIPEDKHCSIFQSFQQADASDSRAHGGAGLGLSITRQLVELHGGEITVESAEETGSIFRFTIPIALNKVETSPTQILLQREIPAHSFSPAIGASDQTIGLPGFDKNICILVVDDDPVNLQVVVNHLSFKNVTVIAAPDGKRAIETIERGTLPDLVLLDIMMPRMTGYEVCRWLRERYTSSEVPIIMLTAKNGVNDLVQGFDHGANDYLVKPFMKDELLARVTSQLKLKESYRALRENMSLRQELNERKESERELRVIQQQLSGILDTIDDALLAVNESEEVTFCNRVCEDMLGYGAGDLLGKPFFSIIQQQPDENLQETKGKAIRDCFSGSKNLSLGIVNLTRSDGRLCYAHAYLSPLIMEEETICLMILRRNTDIQLPDEYPRKGIEHSLGIIEAINQNRARLQSIKMSLNGLTPLINEKQPDFLNELKAIDEALDDIGRTMLNGESFESRRHLAVEVMTCALDYWTESTGLTKTELARQSKLWKTYMNLDGWERTQTLDRYLHIDTFPQRPQWIKILKTTEFVLANGKAPSTLRTRLEVLLTKLRIQK